MIGTWRQGLIAVRSLSSSSLCSVMLAERRAASQAALNALLAKREGASQQLTRLRAARDAQVAARDKLRDEVQRRSEQWSLEAEKCRLATEVVCARWSKSMGWWPSHAAQRVKLPRALSPAVGDGFGPSGASFNHATALQEGTPSF